MQTTPNADVDVVVTFPDEANEADVLWFRNKLEKIPGLVLKTTNMTTSKDSDLLKTTTSKEDL